jgi:hypothetical protein
MVITVVIVMFTLETTSADSNKPPRPRIWNA